MADTQAIKDRIDIVQLIGEYVPLKKAGVNWKANCPFHHEKSPSFMVQAEKQIWHCFGCGKGGDIFSFIQEMEGLDFIESLKLLARRAGVAIETYHSEVEQSQRNRLLEINSTAAYFFHHFLIEIPAAEPARSYLERRQLTKETIATWQIGYVSDQWDLLTKYLLKKGFGIEDLVAAGLTIKREGADLKAGRGYYDRFRGRVMFPINDPHGNVVGFTGRVLVETEHSGGKYVNTPQTPLYDKSRILYGLDKAKTQIKAKNSAVLVEGQMDVVACHQAGMTNVVAASGTALTSEQVKLLKRYTNNLAMAFDADAAGQKAGVRGIDVALEEGMNIKVIQIPAGFAKDADECIKKDPSVWFTAVNNATEIMNWYFSIALTGLDKTNYAKKQEAADYLLGRIARLPHLIERDEWLKRLSQELNIDMVILREEIKNNKKTANVIDRRPAPPPKSQSKLVVKEGPFHTLLQELWSLIVKFPEHYPSVSPLLKESYLVNTAWQDLYEMTNKLYNKEQLLIVDKLRQLSAKPGLENPVDLLQMRPYRNFVELTSEQAKKELEQLLGRIKEEWRKKRGKEIQQALTQAEKAGDKNSIEALIAELQSL